MRNLELPPSVVPLIGIRMEARAPEALMSG
jgi:hypothetical protein